MAMQHHEVPIPGLIRYHRPPLRTRTSGATIVDSLHKSVRDLRSITNVMRFLAKRAGKPLTLSQVTFFLLAAADDLAGRASTRNELLELAGDELTGGIKASYKIFLEASGRRYGDPLGWLTAEPNPEDEREKFLKLTPAGRGVIEGILVALHAPQLPRSRGRPSDHVSA